MRNAQTTTSHPPDHPALYPISTSHIHPLSIPLFSFSTDKSTDHNPLAPYYYPFPAPDFYSHPIPVTLPPSLSHPIAPPTPKSFAIQLPFQHPDRGPNGTKRMHTSPLLLTALAGLTTVYAGYVFSTPPTPGEQVTYLKGSCCRVHGTDNQIATCNKRYCDINMDRVTWVAPFPFPSGSCFLLLVLVCVVWADGWCGL